MNAYPSYAYRTISESRRIKVTLYGLLMLLAALIQGSSPPWLSIRGASPDYMLVLLIVSTIVLRHKHALAWSFGAGILLDLVSSGPIGVSALALTLVTYLCSVGGFGLFRTTYAWSIGAVAICTIVYYLTTMALLTIHRLSIDWTTTITVIIPLTVLYNSLLAVLIYGPVRRIAQTTNRDRYYSYNQRYD